MLLGCIGDDFTGSSDLANTLAKGGMAVTQYCGVPNAPADPSVEAGVVALKSRTIAPQAAVAQSLAALDWLLAQGCRQILFKVCSTFDSTPQGNIGPVAEALMARLGAPLAVVCPVFPTLGRSLYQGHLFVRDRPLDESGMENHPLTPMRDADIRRWLQAQTREGVGHVAWASVAEGPEALRAAIEERAAAGRRLVVVDAIRDADLETIGRAAADMRLLVGGSGIALGLPENFRARGLLSGGGLDWRGAAGPAAILSGSCSGATREQVRRYRDAALALEVTPDALLSGETSAEGAAAWALERARGGQAPLVFSSAEPEAVAAAQARHGRERAADALEGFFADLARRLVEGGVSNLVVAGGETSGAVVEGLELSALAIGPEIAPGVPALQADGRALRLALKSGNFGGPDFFEEALRVLSGGPR